MTHQEKPVPVESLRCQVERVLGSATPFAKGRQVSPQKG